jgi:ribosomal protein S18 acetylase RimI-like enzyme
LHIRPMDSGDYDALTVLWDSFPGTTLTGADERGNFVRFLERNREFCFVAVDGAGKVAGSVMAGYDGRRGYIYHLAVRAGLQGKGTGRRLMSKAEEALASAGVEKAHLFIYVDNPAISFYERIGWHRRPDIEVMSRVLSGDEYTGTRRE